eukprot:jgi/Botrbrau1/11184/Bobra.0214s0010.1
MALQLTMSRTQAFVGLLLLERMQQSHKFLQTSCAHERFACRKCPHLLVPVKKNQQSHELSGHRPHSVDLYDCRGSSPRQIPQNSAQQAHTDG